MRESTRIRRLGRSGPLQSSHREDSCKRLMIPSLILAINQIALAEGLALGRSLGIDPVLLHNVVNTSSGMSSPLRLTRDTYPEPEPIWNLTTALIICSTPVCGANPPPGQSWSSRVNSPLPEVSNSPGSRGYSGGFQSRLMLKASQTPQTSHHSASFHPDWLTRAVR